MFRFLIGNNKGGVGKDLIAEALNQWLLLLGVSPIALLIELETSARLGLLYPDAITIPLDIPSPEAVYANPDAVFAALDRAGELWSQPNISITSLGANVTSALLAWSKAQPSPILNSDEVTFVIPLTMNRHAMAAGLSNLYDIGTTLPAARRVAVLNDVHAAFMPDDRFLARRLEEARGDGKPIDTISLPRCNAPAWGYAQNFGTLAQIANLDPDELIKLGLPEGPVRRSMVVITQWISNALIAQLGGSLLPAVETPTPSKKRVAK